MKTTVKKVSTVIIGRTIKEIYNHAIDYVVYPLVLLKFGYLTGLIIMITVTAVENLVWLFLYMKMKIDWLGYDFVLKIKNWACTERGIKKFIGKALKKSDIIIFFLLSTLRDSFETTTYFKHTLQTNRFKTASIFTVSLIIGNIYWSLGVEIFINSWLKYLIQ